MIRQIERDIYKIFIEIKFKLTISEKVERIKNKKNIIFVKIDFPTFKPPVIS
tara:strand:+ start:254 stop:409 length:156 start_codon:yes stop_codon:yes gene_type:complete